VHCVGSPGKQQHPTRPGAPNRMHTYTRHADGRRAAKVCTLLSAEAVQGPDRGPTARAGAARAPRPLAAPPAWPCDLRAARARARGHRAAPHTTPPPPPHHPQPPFRAASPNL
jgi:hypothetical protein